MPLHLEKKITFLLHTLSYMIIDRSIALSGVWCMNWILNWPKLTYGANESVIVSCVSCMLAL